MTRTKTATRTCIVLALVALSLNAKPGHAAGVDDALQGIVVDAKYPGGNIIVEKVEGDTAPGDTAPGDTAKEVTVHVRQDLRDTSTWWFYWNFRVRGAAGRHVKFQFAGRSPIGVLGPAVSLDGGTTWDWLGSQAVEGSAFEYDFAESGDDVRFAFAMPYQRHDLDRFLAARAATLPPGRLQVVTLCQSRQGRAVPLLRLNARSGNVRRRVLVTARHHACESMASYSLEGLLDAWLAAPDAANDPMKDVEVVVIPLVDYDGVENGDQGKNRKPRDHNRDYDEDGIYPETLAIRKLVANWPSGSVQLAVDLHCPWIRGKHNDVIYMVGSSDRRVAEEQIKLGKILEAACQGPLKYKLSDNVAFGTAWNTANNYAQGVSFGRWAARLDEIQLATTFEIPYATAGGQPVTAQSARDFGHDLARAIAEYLR